MKINSHLLGIGIAIGALAFMVWNTEKEVETIGEYHVYQTRGTFVAERIAGDKLTNPKFGTIEEVRTWVAQQQILDAAKTAAASIIPWGN